MKGTVAEIKDGYVAVLKEDGTITKIKDNNFMIGDVLKVKEKEERKNKRITSMVAMVVMFAMLFSGAAYAYNSTSYYVSLDVNPGVVMKVNRFERVIDTEAVNEEAEELLKDLKLKNKEVEEAVTLVVDRATGLKYIEDKDGNILIVASGKNDEKAEKLAEKLQDAIKDKNEENGVEAEVTSGAVGYEMVQAAKAIEGMTPGKYNIIVNLLGVDPEDAEEYVEVPVKDIMKEFTATKGTEKEKPEDQGKKPKENPAADKKASKDKGK